MGVLADKWGVNVATRLWVKMSKIVVIFYQILQTFKS